jgi:glycosyltransferase involved in cell wall biosynthesis
MRVGFNAFFLGREGAGSGQYTQHLVRAMAQVDPDCAYVLYTRDAEPAANAHAGNPPSETLRGRFADAGVHALRTPFTRRWDNLDKLWFEQVAFPCACRQAAVDVCHVPYFASPFCSTRPTVVTVHDLIPLLLPAYRGSVAVRAYTHLVCAAARRADRIITDSLASRDDIVRHLRVPPERVHVAYLAADPACRRVVDAEALQAVRSKYGLPDTYLLYLGGFDQRKNLQSLLRAYQRARRTLGEEAPPLVVAGRLPAADTPLFPDPRRMAREVGVERHVRFPGWIAEADKPALYSMALAFVFLSLYEGFGLMPLEAMSCGTPVLAANSSSLPEIVGPGGLLVGPQDVDGAAAGMVGLLRDTALRQRLGQQGLRQAARFDWKRTAEQTRQVYELAMSQPRVAAGT